MEKIIETSEKFEGEKLTLTGKTYKVVDYSGQVVHKSNNENLAREFWKKYLEFLAIFESCKAQ